MVRRRSRTPEYDVLLGENDTFSESQTGEYRDPLLVGKLPPGWSEERTPDYYRDRYSRRRKQDDDYDSQCGPCVTVSPPSEPKPHHFEPRRDRKGVPYDDADERPCRICSQPLYHVAHEKVTPLHSRPQTVAS